MFKKGQEEVNFLVRAGIAIGVAVIAVIGILILRGKWGSALAYVRNAFGFG